MSLIEKALAKQKRAHQQEAELKIKQTDETLNEPQILPGVQTDIPFSETEHVAQKGGDTDIVLDFESLVERSYIVDNTKNRLNQEEYRGIKRKLLGNAFGPQAKTLDNSNLIMVTSAKPNEGKTFIANLVPLFRFLHDVFD